MKTLYDVLEVSKMHDRTKNDVPMPREQVRFDDDGMIVLPDPTSPDPSAMKGFPMTDHALSQVCNKTKVPLTYMRDVEGFVRAFNWNYRVQNPVNNQKDWFIRTNGDTVRAVLSTDYTPITNTNVVECLIGIVENRGLNYKLVRPHINPDYMHLRVLVTDLDDGNYGVGFSVTNGETGGHMLHLNPLLQRHICTNSTRWLEGGFSQRHIHVTPAFMRAQLKQHAGTAIKMMPDMVNAMVEAELEQIEDFGDVVKKLVKAKGFSEDVEHAIHRGSETVPGVTPTRANLAFGVSYAAWATDGIDGETSADLELLSGAILVGKDSVFARQSVEVGDE